MRLPPRSVTAPVPRTRSHSRSSRPISIHRDGVSRSPRRSPISSASSGRARPRASPRKTSSAGPRTMDSPVRFIGTVQLGITGFSIALGAVGEPIVEHWIDDPLLSTGLAFVIAFAFVTYLHVTLGELVPKAIALTKNESTALWVALPVEAFYLATYPLVWFLQESSNAVTRLFGIRPAPVGVVVPTEEDVRHML